MLRATGLGRRFGDLWAIRGMDLEVFRGEVLGLLGPNGAGKTTTVRVLTALIEPSEGRASVDGFDVVEHPEEVRARVGILTETPGLYDKLSATANLDFFGRLYGLDASTRAERIERYLRLFSLWDRRDDIAGTFSKGMKQKLAIARALLHDPAVVFLDEPTAALDPEAAYVVREAIEALRRSGRTIVLATHNLVEADRLCDRVAFVRGGLLRIDSPAGLRGSMAAGRGVDVGLASAASEALVAAARSVAGVGGVEAVDHRLVVAAADPAAIDAGPRAVAGRGRRRHRRGPRARDDARGGLLRGHGRPARPGRGRLMRGRIVTDGPAPGMVGDGPQPPADVDHPDPAGGPDDRAACPGRRRREPGAAARSSRPRSSPQRPEWAAFTPVRAGRGLRGPAVPRLLPADAGVHPAVDRDVLDHRREAGPDAGARARDTDPDESSC